MRERGIGATASLCPASAHQSTTHHTKRETLPLPRVPALTTAIMDPTINLAALGLFGPLDGSGGSGGDRRRPRGKGFRGNADNAKTKICLR